MLLLMAQKLSLAEHWDTGRVRLACGFKTKTFSTLDSSEEELTFKTWGYRRTVMGSQGDHARLHSCN